MAALARALATGLGRSRRDSRDYGGRLRATTKLLAELLQHLASLLLRDKLELHAAATDGRRVVGRTV